mgnify:FL=1
MSDPLEGFRDRSPAEIEAEFRRQLGPDDFLLDLLQLGEEMQAWVDTPAGAFIHSTLRDRVNEALAALLAQPTVDTPEARRFHGEARAAFQALELIQNTIRTGRMADKTLTAQESTPQ